MIGKNALYKKDDNRYLNKRLELRPTTLIMGAKCIDGVVLVGDRKVTSELGNTTMNKIRQCENLTSAIFGAAGIGSLFEEFLTLLPEKVNTHYSLVQYRGNLLMHQHNQNYGNSSNSTPPPLPSYRYLDFIHDCVELLTEMRSRYSVAFANPMCRIDVLMGMAIHNENPRLYYLDSADCLPVEIHGNLVSIGQASLAEVFRKCWNDAMTMEQTAKIGMLAIKYIEQEEISNSVGVGSEQPQVWYIPNNHEPVEVTGNDLSIMVNDVDTQVTSLRTQLHSLFRS